MLSSPCMHTTLFAAPSPNAALAGYTQPTPQKRVAAATSFGRAPRTTQAPSPWTFPAPLILPGDELSFEPSYPPQSFRSWKQEKERNPVTSEKKTIYVAAPPEVDAGEAYIREWARSPKLDRTGGDIAQPCVEDIVGYLTAFYYPLPVRLLPAPLRLTSWDVPRQPKFKSKSKSAAHTAVNHVALAYGDSCTRIRVRAQKQGVYTHQLNLNDILDAAIESLPDDAYAILLLVEHDIYEEDDDDFACGRAYGGSRVAVISSARYHPGLDAEQGLERGHAWPASHCAAYVKRMCEEAVDEDARPKKKARTSKTWDGLESGPVGSPLRAAISALLAPSTSPSPARNTTDLLYLARIVLTSSHELGHCLGLDHCVYYACLMDGAASLAEDIRGAPYLCAVCTIKVGAAGEEASDVRGEGPTATRGKEKSLVKKDTILATSRAELERNRRLHAICLRWEAGDMFRAFGAWLSARIVELEEELEG